MTVHYTGMLTAKCKEDDTAGSWVGGGGIMPPQHTHTPTCLFSENNFRLHENLLAPRDGIAL